MRVNSTSKRYWAAWAHGFLAIVAVSAQPVSKETATRTFEVATIKPNTSGGPFSIRTPSPGVFAATNVTLLRLLTIAYRVQTPQIIGGPDWMRSARFDVVAKGDEGATREEVFSMLRELLAERYMVKLHRDTRELSHYELQLAKNGSKLIKGEEGACAKALQASRTCSDLAELDNGLAGVNVSMAVITRALGSLTEGRPVVDKTGLTGTFDIKVMWKAGGRGNNGKRGDEYPDSLFVALQEQAGLRLSSARGAIEVLVIDYAEMPSEN